MGYLMAVISSNLVNVTQSIILHTVKSGTDHHNLVLVDLHLVCLALMASGGF